MSKGEDVLSFNERLSTLENIRFQSGDWTEDSLKYAHDDMRKQFFKAQLKGTKTYDTRRRLFEKITFITPFKTKPTIIKGLSCFDIGEARDNARIDVKVEGLSKTDFTLIIETWMGTQIHGFRIEWIAYTT